MTRDISINDWIKNLGDFRRQVSLPERPIPHVDNAIRTIYTDPSSNSDPSGVRITANIVDNEGNVIGDPNAITLLYEGVDISLTPLFPNICGDLFEVYDISSLKYPDVQRRIERTLTVVDIANATPKKSKVEPSQSAHKLTTELDFTFFEDFGANGFSGGSMDIPTLGLSPTDAIYLGYRDLSDNGRLKIQRRDASSNVSDTWDYLSSNIPYTQPIDEIDFTFKNV